MFATSHFTTAVDSAVSELQKIQMALSGVSCPEITSMTVNLNNLSQPVIDELVRHVPTGYGKSENGVDYIYVIGIGNERPALMRELIADLTAARQVEGGDYSRVNGENSDSRTLYVGRSKALRARLKQHLGAGGRGVYSLHLQRWATAHDAELTISIMRFSDAGDRLVQALEDGLWNSLQPAFGRKGER